MDLTLLNCTLKMVQWSIVCYVVSRNFLNEESEESRMKTLPQGAELRSELRSGCALNHSTSPKPKVSVESALLPCWALGHHSTLALDDTPAHGTVSVGANAPTNQHVFAEHLCSGLC